MPGITFKKRIWILIVAATIIHCIIAATINLGNDEVYYWTYALHLRWNYFDHPPVIALLIRLFTFNLHAHYAFFVRLPAIISSAIATYIIFKTGTLIRNEQTGWYAALLYTTSLYSSIIAGTFILPDSPQMVFWMAAIYILIKIFKEPASDKKYWIYFGILAGICTMCKVHGIFLWAGAGLYILLFKRKELLNGWIYLAFLITAIIVSPIIIWNINNHFITYTYHSSRVVITHSGFNITSFVREITGEFFYNNPVNYILTWIAVAAILKGRKLAEKSTTRLLLCCSLPLILILIFISAFRDTLPHWSGPAYTTLILLSAAYLDEKLKNREGQFLFPGFIKWAASLFLIIAAGGILIINYYPGTLGSKNNVQYGSGDFTLDMYGWKEAGNNFKKIYDTDVQDGRMKKDAFIISDKWFPLAHIEFYIAYLTHQTVLGIGEIDDIHEYKWLDKTRPQLYPGADAYCIVPSNYYLNVEAHYGKLFNEIQKPVIIKEYRSGKLARLFYIYRLIGYRNP
jgi:4-amino-4-deoxy-L-arabinose transferase-like glycosyltransferase